MSNVTSLEDNTQTEKTGSYDIAFFFKPQYQNKKISTNKIDNL